MADKTLIAAVASAVAVGGVAGALLFAPVLSGAQEQEDPTTTTEAEGEDEVREHAFGLGHGPLGAAIGLDAAAEALGMSAEELRDALADGQTIAEVAEAQGVDIQEVIDAMVAAANDNIDEAVAELREELPERISEFVNEGFRGGDGFGRPGPRLRFGLFASIDAAAEAIGITEDDLRDALVDGQTIAEVAEAEGVEAQTVIDAVVADATARIDDAVADGDLDEDRAADLKEDLVERVTDAVNGEFRFPGRGPWS
jgi:hypothetical protein